MRTVLLTSDSLRHKYIGASLAEFSDLQLVVTEKKSSKIQQTTGYGKSDTEFLNAHFKRRSQSEEAFFGRYNEFPKGIPHFPISHGQINSPEVFERIKAVEPDMIVLFGTSIIKPPLLSDYAERIVNLHLGLSPYYRGSATNLYPYLFDEPECIGATIHIATEKVDEGGILYQLRPEVEEDDDLHDIGNKTILKAGEVLPDVLESYAKKRIRPVSQMKKGRLCRIKDITPYVLREIYKNFEEGIISRYLKHKKKRDQKKPIVTPAL